MADLGETFKAADNRGEPMDPVPAGTYECVISDTEFRDTSSGGKMLRITYTILSGEQKGRKIWQGLNLRNKNADTVRISREHLSAVCDAAGVPEVRDTTKLHMRRVRVVVKVEEEGEYGPRNSVRKVMQSASNAAKVPEKPAEKHVEPMHRDGLDAKKERPAWLKPRPPQVEPTLDMLPVEGEPEEGGNK